MKKEILPIIILFFAFPALAQYSVKGGSGTPLRAVNDTKNIIEVYMLNGLSDAQITYTSSADETHQWYKYKEKASEATPVTSQQTSGNTSFITDVEDGYGYYVGSPASMSTSYLWIIDYSKYVPVFSSLTIQEDEYKCERLKLVAEMEAAPLRYYTYKGIPETIERKYHLQYSDLEWDDKNKVFVPNDKGIDEEGLIYEIEVGAPLKDTDFVLTGDDFAQHFGLQQSISTPVYSAIAVDAHGVVEQHKEKADNENSSDTEYGGSAPVDITFTAYANEPVAAFYIWKVSKVETNGTTNTIVRYTDKVLRYTFEQSGDYIVQLEVIDAKSVCVDTSQVFKVFIGTSSLKIPNAFSPGSSPGVNDEFKVSYESIVSFRASIFNRWGNLLYQWSDPSKGWDGKVSGKYVPSGVYFYVIEAKGADGIRYKKSGDINILRSKF